ncbi:MAG: acyltransferase [Clostridia bacterium]|nr:acyltransferase [Clostridia bacterium]MBR2175555.1 acyltransferase [Clostridia bacterium]
MSKDQILRAEQTFMPERWDGFDILKAICAFLIVCIHAPFVGEGGQYFLTLTRIAVPIFFMITGFFYTSMAEKGKLVRQIKKVFILMVQANLLFFIWKMLMFVLSGGEITVYLKTVITVNSVLKFLFLNESPFNGHLWYLGAILYVLIIVMIFDKLGQRKLLYVVTPLLLIGDLVLGKYSILIFGREFPYIFVRNFLFVGIPYFCIGRLIFEHKDFIRRQVDNRKRLLVFISVLFAGTSLLERFFLVNADMNAVRDHYISTTFLAVTVFVLFLSYHCNPGVSGKPSGLKNILAAVGRSDSTWIYIIHPIFITILAKIAKTVGMADEYTYVRPIVVFIITLVFVEVFRRICISVLKAAALKHSAV